MEDVTTRRRVQFFLFLDLNLVLKNSIPGKFSDIVILWGLYHEIIVIIAAKFLNTRSLFNINVVAAVCHVALVVAKDPCY